MQFSKIETAGTAEIGGITGRLVGVTGVEPVTSSLSGTRSNQLSYTPGCVGGGNGIRTRDFQLAKLALYQLSYAPLDRSRRSARPNSRVTPTFSNIHAPHSKQKWCGKHAACVASCFFCGPGRAGAHRALAGG